MAGSVNPNDPNKKNRIDVMMSLMGGEEAVKKFGEQLGKTITSETIKAMRAAGEGRYPGSALNTGNSQYASTPQKAAGIQAGFEQAESGLFLQSKHLESAKAEQEARQTGRFKKWLGRTLQTGGGGYEYGGQQDQDGPPASEGGSIPPAPSLSLKTAWEGRAKTLQGKPLDIPRFGEFTARDTLLHAERGLLAAAGMAKDTWADPIANTLGNIGAGAGAFSQVLAPYQNIKTRFGIPGMNPFVYARQSAAYGASPGTAVGPAMLPFEAGGAFGIQLSEGAREEADVITEALEGMWKPGISTAGKMEFMNQVRGSGIAPTQKEFSVISDLWEDYVQRAGSEEGVAENAPAMFHEMVRFGTTSQDELDQIFDGMAEGAESALMSLDDFSLAVQSAGEQLETMGLSLEQGVRAAEDFSYATNLPPDMLPAMLENPYVQANIMGSQGLFPQQMGLYAQSTGGMVGQITKTAEQLRGTIAGGFDRKTIKTPWGKDVISPREQETAMVAGLMGVNPRALEKMERFGDQWKTQGHILSGVKTLQEKERAIRSGNFADEDQRVADLYAGEGDFAGRKKLPTISELEGLAGKGYGKTGIRKRDLETLQDIEDPRERAEELRKIIRKNEEQFLSQDKNEVMVTVKPPFDKMFKAIANQNQEERSRIREGDAPSNGIYGRPITNPGRPENMADSPHPWRAANPNWGQEG